MRARITLNTDTFYAVLHSKKTVLDLRETKQISYRYQVWYRFQSRHDLLKMMQLVRSSFPGEFLGVGLHKISSKFTGEQSGRSGISIKLQSNFMAWAFSCKYVHIFRNSFPKDTSGRRLSELYFFVVFYRDMTKASGFLRLLSHVVLVFEGGLKTETINSFGKSTTASYQLIVSAKLIDVLFKTRLVQS